MCVRVTIADRRRVVIFIRLPKPPAWMYPESTKVESDSRRSRKIINHWVKIEEGVGPGGLVYEQKISCREYGGNTLLRRVFN